MILKTKFNKKSKKFYMKNNKGNRLIIKIGKISFLIKRKRL